MTGDLPAYPDATSRYAARTDPAWHVRHACPSSPIGLRMARPAEKCGPTIIRIHGHLELGKDPRLPSLRTALAIEKKADSRFPRPVKKESKVGSHCF